MKKKGSFQAFAIVFYVYLLNNIEREESIMEQNSNTLILRPSWRNFFLKYMIIFGVIVVIFFIAFSSMFSILWKEILCIIGIALIVFIYLIIVLNRLEECLKICEDEVIMTQGILNKRSTEIGIPQIRTIQVQQRLIQRVLDIGDIYIASAGTESYEIVAHGINKPHEIRDKLQSHMRLSSTKSDKEKEDKQE